MTIEVAKERSAKERAKRLKCLREMTGLSRIKFQDRYGVPRGTLQNWETARFGGLTEKGAKNIVQVFHAEGISCSTDWLLFGTGSGPTFIEKTSNSFKHEQSHDTPTNQTSETNTQNSSITQELLLFRHHNKNTIDLIVVDDAMTPLWDKGDCIAGVKLFRENIKLAIGKNCIVQTKEYGTIFRHVTQGENDKLFNLCAINYRTTIKKPVIYNCEVISAAPVLWTRKADPKT